MNESVIRVVVIVLGIVSCLCIGGMVHVAASGREPPASLVLIAGNAIGALVGILVQQRDPPNWKGGQR